MILNQIALNPIVNYQQIANQIHQQLPSLLMPISGLDPASAARPVEEKPLDHEKSSELIELHTLIDDQPWLKQLYQHWQQALRAEFAQFPLQPSLPEPDHWRPDTTAKAIHALGLAYAGWLIHKHQQETQSSIERITLTWRNTWETFQHELLQDATPPQIVQILVNTAHFFQQYWLESWLHIADLQASLPTNPAEKNALTG